MINFFIWIDSFFWANIAFILIMGLGIFLTIRMRFFQIRSIPSLLKNTWGFFSLSTKQEQGIHPLRLFFASVGGMIGIGNIIGIVTALQIGGPGALFWIWVAAFFGSVIKYAEIYLGLKYRVVNEQGHYEGGPIYFLRVAFKRMWAPILVAGLFCIYGVEIYQFTVLTDIISTSWHVNRIAVMLLLLVLVLFSSIGGVQRLAKICSSIMPFFVLIYVGMSFYIIGNHMAELPGIFVTIFSSAFTGHGAVGGFVGSSVFLAIQHGMARAAYSSDIGIGYDSMIQSESCVVEPEKQAGLAIFGVFIDNLICTISIMLVLISGLWKASPALSTAELMQNTLSMYFPYMQVFLPTFLLITGYTTIIAYLCVGLKCARFLSPRFGERGYLIYATFAFIFFSFFDPSLPLLVMSLAGAMLLIVNLLGIFRLQRHVEIPGKKALKKASAAQTEHKEDLMVR